MKHLEIRTIDCDGIRIAIRVDYDMGTLTLVERSNNDGGWKAKQFLFANRTLDYLNSWDRIMEAMQIAVKEGKKLLEADLAEKTKFDEGFITGLAHMASKNTPSKKKKK